MLIKLNQKISQYKNTLQSNAEVSVLWFIQKQTAHVQLLFYKVQSVLVQAQ